MNTKTIIRRFLWHRCPGLHSLIYNNRFNREEYQELISLISNHEKKGRKNNHQLAISTEH